MSERHRHIYGLRLVRCCAMMRQNNTHAQNLRYQCAQMDAGQTGNTTAAPGTIPAALSAFLLLIRAGLYVFAALILCPEGHGHNCFQNRNCCARYTPALRPDPHRRHRFGYSYAIRQPNRIWQNLRGIRTISAPDFRLPFRIFPKRQISKIFNFLIWTFQLQKALPPGGSFSITFPGRKNFFQNYAMHR